VRAGSRQVIDVVAIVIENAFRPANGRFAAFSSNSVIKTGSSSKQCAGSVRLCANRVIENPVGQQRGELSVLLRVRCFHDRR
jgi:hypothetical protein